MFSLDVLLQHDGASQAVLSAMALNGEFGRLAVQYLGLFRPEKTALTMERLAKLLNELLEVVNANGFMRNGQQISTSLDGWIDGLQAVLANRQSIKRPLTSHNYLFEVVSQRQGKINTNAVVLGIISIRTAPLQAKQAKRWQV